MRLSRLTLGLLLLAASCYLPGTAVAQSFSFTNLAVLRVGDGTNPLVNTGGAISILEISQTGTVLNTVNVTSTGASGLQISGTATSEGILNSSTDPGVLTIAGYNPGVAGFGGTGSLASRSSANAPRAFGNFNLSTATYSFGAAFPVNAGTDFSTNNIRSAVTTPNGTYAVGGNSGVVLNPSTAIITSSVNNRVIQAKDGDLFFSTGAGGASVVGVYRVTGFPTGADTASAVINASTLTAGSTIGSSPYGFAFSLDLS